MSGSSSCDSCGAAVVWAVHASSGKRSPFDAEPAELGNWSLAREGGELVARYAGPVRHGALELGDISSLPGFYVPHFATCPDAADWRRR